MKFFDKVCDNRRPEKIGRFNGWFNGACGKLAIVKFPREKGTHFVAVQYVEKVRAKAQDEETSFANRSKAQKARQQRVQALAITNQHLKHLADKFGLTVEEYIDAIT